MNIAIIGATDKTDRYAYMAFKALLDHGHKVFLVNPGLKLIDGHDVYGSIKDIPVVLDTVTMYVGPKASSLLARDILEKRPGHIIFNPGAENPELEVLARQRGIAVVNDCTLVMLKTGKL
jgi:predicted CoA-binding protein